MISGTGTAVGKTAVACALVRWLALRETVAGLKPFETGGAGELSDARQLAQAAGRPELARLAGLYRSPEPLAPRAAELGGAARCSSATVLRVVRNTTRATAAVVEGIGGLGTPLARGVLFAHFAQNLGWPVVLVARDELGAISNVLSALALAERHEVSVAAVVLTRLGDGDPSRLANGRIILELSRRPVVAFDLERAATAPLAAVESLARSLDLDVRLPADREHADQRGRS